MTNYEAMRTMDIDDLAEFLLSILDGEAMRTLMDKDEMTEFLSSIASCDAIRIMDKDELAKFLLGIVACKKCPASEKFCDHRDCDDAILNWLNAELDDDIVVEHSKGQTINISHANVVIID